MRILIHTPFGKDGQHLNKVLSAEGHECLVCEDIRDFGRLFNTQVDVLLTTEEVVGSKNLAVLSNELKNQPSWSSIPVIVFYTPYLGQLSIGPKEDEPIWKITELNFIPRPVSSLVLLNAIKSAGRDRQRQYKIRDLLEQLQQDIERRKNYENKLREKVEELNAERQMREQFVSTLTHDLRTPLTSAKLNADLLARKAHDPEVIRTLAKRVSESIDRGDKMIRDLLDANRIKAGEPVYLDIQPIELLSLMKEILDELSGIYGARFKLESDQAIAGFWCKESIRRMVENLLSNAAKYGAPKTWITLSLNLLENSMVEIAIHNLGPPIPVSDLENLFDPFRRVAASNPNKQKGWGLGLTLVRGLAQAHGGEVSFSSNEAQGTTFVVKLPLDARPS